MCVASPPSPSPDLLNISCDRISWSSIRIRIGLICERWRKEWMAWCRSGPRSAVRTFPCPWPALRGQCDCVVLYVHTSRITVSGRSLPGLYHLLLLHVLQQDMLVVLPFSLLFRSTPRGEGWKGSEAHHFLILWDLVKSRMSNYLLRCQKLTKWHSLFHWWCMRCRFLESCVCANRCVFLSFQSGCSSWNLLVFEAAFYRPLKFP